MKNGKPMRWNKLCVWLVSCFLCLWVTEGVAQDVVPVKSRPDRHSGHVSDSKAMQQLLKFIQVSRGGRGFTSLVFGMGQLSEEGIAKKIAEQISVIVFKAPRLLHMEKEFTLLREAALRAYRQESVTIL